MATRIYLPSSGAAAVSPAFSASWDDTADATRIKCVTTKSSTAMTTTQYRDNSNKDEDHLIHQWVSNPIGAQTIQAQTLKFQMRALEGNASNNLVMSIGVRVVSNDGSTVTGTCLDVTRDDTELATGTLTNRQFSATTSSVTASANDRIVIEIGVGGDPAGGNNHDADIRIGDAAASDLAENDTSTTDNNPWVEFATDTITFVSDAVPSLDGYRFYDDDGSESGSTQLLNENTATLIDDGTTTQFHLRLMVQDTGGAGGNATDDWQLQYQVNGGGYGNVTTSSSTVKAVDSSNLTDAGATTNRATDGLTDGSGTFVAGKICEDGLLDDFQLTADNFTELVYSLGFNSASLGDKIEFRLQYNGTAITSNETPTIYVNTATITRIYSQRNSTGDITITGVAATADDEGIFVLTSCQDSNHANYPVSSITRDGQNFTEINAYEASGNNGVEGWYLLSPNSGSADLTVDFAGPLGEATASVVVVKGINTSTQPDDETGETGSTSHSTLNVTSSVDGDMLLHVLCAESDTTAVGTDQVIIADFQDQSFENSIHSFKGAAGSGTESMSATKASDASFAQMAVAIRAAGAAPPAVVTDEIFMTTNTRFFGS